MSPSPHGSEMATGTTTTGSTEMTMGMMGMDMMHMTFFNSMDTSLYSLAWTPTNSGQYAATCVFLIVLAIVFRGLLAAKAWKESAWLDAEFNRRYVAVQGKGPLSERIGTNMESKRMTLHENGVEEDVMVVKKKGLAIRPWRLSVDPLRAAIDTVIAGVGYLLMLAVMTMNIGYFASVLGGVFIGSLLVGRYAITFEH